MSKLWMGGAIAAFVSALAVSASAQVPATPAAPAKTQAAAKAPAAAKLPAPAAEAFKKSYPDATIKTVSKEVEAGKTVYEVESVDKGLNRDLVYAADGTVLECEEQIKPAELPAPVAEAFKALYPNATITKAERTTKGQAVQYDLAVKGVPGTRELSFAADGKPIRAESKK